MTFHDKTANAARGKWRGILLEIGIPEGFLRDKHGPCPFCGGVDRFRFDDKEGRGSFICGQCGAGNGIDMVMRFTGLPFPEAASRVDEIIRNVKPDSIRQPREMTDEERRSRLNAVWRDARKPEPGDLLHTYIASRGLDAHDLSTSLRFAPALRDGEGGVRPAMVAMVTGPDGKPATLHRTFLRPDGKAKAEMASPRKLMPGPVPEGAAIRLGAPGEAIGIAEGIETAMAAAEMFELPVWAAINSAMLEKWSPPDGVSEVCIFGDNDPKFGGHAAAYALAHRLSRTLDVTVKIPPAAGQDWNDILLLERSAA